MINGAQTNSDELAKHLVMLRWEGATLLLSILIGGLLIFWFMRRETKERRRLEKFLLTFTHELKTPLASIQLQAESIAEMSHEAEVQKLCLRLIDATTRLTLQLENSLLLASAEKYQVVLEPIAFTTALSEAAYDWPSLQVQSVENATILGDKRVLSCVMRNIFSNAVLHGKASILTCSFHRPSAGRVTISFRDNGKGAQGEVHAIGKLFSRPYQGSGNGIGLYVSQKLLNRIHGSLDIETATDGFTVRCTFEEAVS